MAYNKVIYKGEVIMDITDSTVTPETLDEGIIAYGANGERIVGIDKDESGLPIEVNTLDSALLTEGNKGKFYECDDRLYQVTKAKSLKGLTIKFNEHLTNPCPISEDASFECSGMLENLPTDPELINALTRNTSAFDDFMDSFISGLSTYTSGIVFRTDMDSHIFYLFDDNSEATRWWLFDYNGNITESLFDIAVIRNFDCPDLNENAEFMEWVFANAKVYSKIESLNDIKAFRLNVTANGDYDYPLFPEFTSATMDAFGEITGDYGSDPFNISGQYVASFAINGEVITKEFSNFTNDHYGLRFDFSDDNGNSLDFSANQENYKVTIKYNDTILEDEPTFTKFDCTLNNSVYLRQYMLVYGELINMDYIDGLHFVEWVNGSPLAHNLISVDELPTENIDTEALYLCNGEYYKYVEGGNTWVFNDELTLDTSLNCEFAFEFEGYADTKNGTGIRVQQIGGPYPHLQYQTDLFESYGPPKYANAYCFTEYWGGSVGWLKEEYKTITIKEMPTDETFIAWLNANAKPASGWMKYVVPSGAIVVTENGSFDVTDKEKVNVNVTMPTNLVLGVDELPTENINEEAIYIYNGELYRYSKTWVFKDVITPLVGEWEMHFQCVGWDQHIIGMKCSEGGGLLYLTDYRPFPVYNFTTNTWDNEMYKTLLFYEEYSLPTDEAFLTWLRANTKQGGWRKYTLATE